ncbi:MAG: DNA-directed RNA polymerase subunit beta' [Mycoplasmataceae bacterium]|nr:DNA-directed RNA polymerase subunit beta' [Mycoplasmataceae bacterium]
MPISSKRYVDIDENKIEKVSLAIATPEDVLEWSNGEVTKPETINYKTYKPEPDGLFDELIFGPVTDYRCPICAKKYKRSSEGLFCEATELCKEKKPLILPKISRRSRMGHIKLNSPVVHFWFFKVDNSIITKLLGLKVGDTDKSQTRVSLEGVIYYKSHIVLESGGLKSLPKNLIIEINDAASIYRDALLEIREKFEPNSDEYSEITLVVENLEERATSKEGKDYGIDFYELNEIIEEYSSAKIDSGVKAIEYLLKNFDLQEAKKEVKNEIDKLTKQILSNKEKGKQSKILQREKLYKRIKIINSFIKSKQHPKDMLIYNLPVIPVDLRPLVQLDGGRHSTSDINELYRRIIIRNNRLKKWQESDAPILILQNELRMIQEAVDALIDNAKRTSNQVVSKDNRPLKSIADALTGKKGRFRQNLLGKRVDYSGRSVIVVGPELKMHQVGIPREMATKLFEPWIVKELIDKQITSSIKGAKKLIDDLDPRIWPYVAKVIKDKPVLLNRAPTLHRLSIQAFDPVLIRGKAIKLHPLVTTAFNADFDGDQMAIHVPISEKAMYEARELIMANRNILGPKDGEPIINPSQDIVLGLYYLSLEKPNLKGDGKFFLDYDSMMIAYQNKEIDLHSRIAIPYSSIKPELAKENPKRSNSYIISTVGKFIFNNVMPEYMPFIFNNSVETLEDKEDRYFVQPGTDIKEVISNLEINEPFTKKSIAKIIRRFFESYVSNTSIRQVASVIKLLNNEMINDYNKVEKEFQKINSLVPGQTISKENAKILTKLVIQEYQMFFKKIELENLKHNFVSKEIRELEKSEKISLTKNVWFNYTNQVASVLDKIKELGFKYSTTSGITFSYSDIISADNKEENIAEGNIYVDKLKQKFQLGLITDYERYSLTIKKWAEIKQKIQDNLDEKVEKNPFNPIHMMIKSGARGNISNLVQLAGIRGLMANNTKQLKADAQNEREVYSVVEVPVKSSFLDGLSAYEFYSSTHGARKGLTDTALNTARSGYLTRRLVDVGQSIVVREEDCGSDFGYKVKSIMDTRTKQVIVDYKERIEGRFTNSPIFDKNDKMIVDKNVLITPEIVKKISAAKITQVDIRSILGCHTRNGVCKKCYGKDLATNRVVSIGEAVGIIAAQSIGEPGTQLTMRTFHSGGVAGVEDITGGFGRLIELIDAYDKPWGRPAVIASKIGKIVSIKPDYDQINIEIVELEYYAEDGKKHIEKYEISSNVRKRVKVGDSVVPGQKITDGPIILKELLRLTSPRTVQNYLLKEIQRIYRMQGISISDKYIEIIIRQMLSKIVITDAGDSTFFVGSIEDIFTYQEVAKDLIAKGKKPPYGTVVIKGAKQTPLLSESFLAAASYQETSKILVHAAISNQVDNLEGLKENIILGHKIPVGTSSQYEQDSKYDLLDLEEFFNQK